MSYINYKDREINFKVVYYGLCRSGRQTNFLYVRGKTNWPSRGRCGGKLPEEPKPWRAAFEFAPLSLGEIRGFKLKYHLVTVLGKPDGEKWREVLKGVDGLIIIIDSRADRVEENLECLQELREHLDHVGVVLQEVPAVIQYNKQDLPDALPPEELKKILNPDNLPEFEAVATAGRGVIDSLHLLAKMVLYKAKYGGSRSSRAGKQGISEKPPIREIIDLALELKDKK